MIKTVCYFLTYATVIVPLKGCKLNKMPAISLSYSLAHSHISLLEGPILLLHFFVSQRFNSYYLLLKISVLSVKKVQKLHTFIKKHVHRIHRLLPTTFTQTCQNHDWFIMILAPEKDKNKALK